MTSPKLEELTLTFTRLKSAFKGSTSFGFAFGLLPASRRVQRFSPCCSAFFVTVRSPNALPRCGKCHKEYPRELYRHASVEDVEFSIWLEGYFGPLEAIVVGSALQEKCAAAIEACSSVELRDVTVNPLAHLSGPLFPTGAP